MSKNNIFSFLRLWMIFRRDLVENWRTNIHVLTLFFVVFIVPIVTQMYNLSSSESTFYNPVKAFDIFCLSYVTTIKLILSVASLYFASNIMQSMSTKEKRISFLMLPATPVEKFVSRFLYVTVGLILIFFLGMFVAEVVHFLMLPLLNLPDTFYQPIYSRVFTLVTSTSDVANKVDVLFQMNFWGILYSCVCFLWLHSIYILGGNIWYKKPFFKTLGTLIVMLILLIIFIVYLAKAVVLTNFANWMSLHYSERNIDLASFDWIWFLGIAVFTSFVIFNYWLSYKLFTRSQIVKPKFRLL